MTFSGALYVDHALLCSFFYTALPEKKMKGWLVFIVQLLGWVYLQLWVVVAPKKILLVVGVSG